MTSSTLFGNSASDPMAAHPLFMPRLGMTMEEGTVVDWPVGLGASVRQGETVLVIESEKAEVDIEAPAPGYFRHIFIESGETVPCGTLLGALTDSSDEAFEAEALLAAHPPPKTPPAQASRAPSGAPLPAPSGSGPASASPRSAPVAPAARALAKQLGLDLDGLAGSGPGGRVVRQDVERLAHAMERRIRLPEGVALEVLREGEGSPVILLPGFGSDISSFALQWPSLARDFEVIGINPLGVGYSDAVGSEENSVAASARRVLAVMDALELEQAYLVGASLGAALALEVALMAPERVFGLGLITPFVEAGPRLQAVIEAWPRVAAEASTEALGLFLAPWLFSPASLAQATRKSRLIRGLTASLGRISHPALVHSADALRNWSGTRVANLTQVGTPSLVLAGESDLLAPEAKAVAEALPAAEFQCLTGAAHALMVEVPEEVGAALRTHIRGCQATAD